MTFDESSYNPLWIIRLLFVSCLYCKSNMIVRGDIPRRTGSRWQCCWSGSCSRRPDAPTGGSAQQHPWCSLPTGTNVWGCDKLEVWFLSAIVITHYQVALTQNKVQYRRVDLGLWAIALCDSHAFILMVCCRVGFVERGSCGCRRLRWNELSDLVARMGHKDKQQNTARRLQLFSFFFFLGGFLFCWQDRLSDRSKERRAGVHSGTNWRIAVTRAFELCTAYKRSPRSLGGERTKGSELPA